MQYKFRLPFNAFLTNSISAFEWNSLLKFVFRWPLELFNFQFSLDSRDLAFDLTRGWKKHNNSLFMETPGISNKRKMLYWRKLFCILFDVILTYKNPLVFFFFPLFSIHEKASREILYKEIFVLCNVFLFPRL